MIEEDGSRPAESALARKRGGRSAPGVTARALRALLHRFADPAIEFELWNGESVATSSRAPVARVRIADRPTLLRLLLHPTLEFGEAYSAGRIEVQGDLVKLVEEIYRGGYALRSSRSRARSNTLAHSRDHIHHHYDIGNEFYALWLGDTMAYTCAYYPHAAASLDEAQIAKMNLVGRKLRLRPEERIVEAGCGWGSLALHLAQAFGVRVTAFNISREQIAFARERARAAGLASRVEFIEDDYRNIPGHSRGAADAFVSVGMLEHVGVEHFAELGRAIKASLAPSGRGFIHTIGRTRPGPLNAWIEKRIFPGAYPPSLKQIMEIFEAEDYAVIDLENLRPHYAKTLNDWRSGFERSSERIARMFDPTFVRMWRLYLAGSEAAFNTGDLQLFQILFAQRADARLPWTRADIYQDDRHDQPHPDRIA